jgi:hypothetical protein
LGERVAMPLAGPFLRRLPKGDGHQVLVLPGFTAGDRSTRELRRTLDDLGYDSRGWHLGANFGPTPGIVAGLANLAESIQRSGERISIVGWSLGGIFGRELARRIPDSVRQVITLGSPIHMTPDDPSATSELWESVRHRHQVPRYRPALERERPPLPVPTTSVYTRRDGIVHWSTCVIESGPRAENVEVHGSHCGLGFNPAVIMVVADRLAQPDGEWSPFRAPLYARPWFPPAVDRDVA